MKIEVKRIEPELRKGNDVKPVSKAPNVPVVVGGGGGLVGKVKEFNDRHFRGMK